MKQLIFILVLFFGCKLNAQVDSIVNLKFSIDTVNNTLKLIGKTYIGTDSLFLDSSTSYDSTSFSDTILTDRFVFNNLLWESEAVKLSCENYKILSICASDSMNCVNLNEAYTEAKASTPQGDALSATNRYTLILPSGYYNCADTFRVDSQYVDIVSLTGNRDIIFNGATIKVTANDVFIKGIDVGTGSNTFLIDGNLNNLKIDNCRGSGGSFGASSITVSGTFTNCVGGNGSFGSTGSTSSGTFINCTAGQSSFGRVESSGTFTNCTAGNYSFAFTGTASGTFTNCVAGIASFGSTGGTLSGTFTNCVGGSVSFNGTITGKLQYCRINGTGSFPAVSGGGTNNHYVNGDGSNDNSAGSAQDLTYVPSTGIMNISGGTGDTINVATSTERGLLPTPPNDTTKYLRGDATWQTISSGGADEQDLSYTAATGIMAITNGTSATIPTATATTRGLVPDPPNDENYYLAGDGTFDEFREKIIVLDSSYNTNSTTFVNIGKLSVTLAAGNYYLELNHVHSSNVSSEGCAFNIATGTATLGDATYYRAIYNGLTSSAISYNFNPNNFQSGANGNTSIMSGEVRAYIQVTSAGTIIPKFRAETGDENSCTVKSGLTFLKILKL